jgi:YHS domain-containing protein
MGDLVASPAMAAGFRDHGGKRYWFCCNSCEQLFDEDAARYADGNHLRAVGKAHGGGETPACEG